jgi:ATP-dependent NAD(P)H-hydrate dehydratase
MHSIVIGPGLGRTESSWEFAKVLTCFFIKSLLNQFYLKNVITCAKERQMSIILDADALFMLSNDYFLIDGYKKCFLTPNKMEFKRLYEQIVS